MKKLIVAMMLVAFVAAGCSKSDPPRNYVNTANKFRLNKPDDWTELTDWNTLGKTDLSELSLDGTICGAFLSPERTPLTAVTSVEGTSQNPQPSPRAIISVKLLKAPSNGGGKELFAQEQAELIAKLTGDPNGDFKIIPPASDKPADNELTTGNGKAYFVKCTWTKGGLAREGLFVFVISARRAAIVMCGCAASDFDHYETTFRQTCESFFLDVEQQ